MPLLARLLPAPLTVDVRRGAIADLGPLLADRRIATEGRVAVAVGPGVHGDGVAAGHGIGEAEVFRVEDATVDTAVSLGKTLRAGSYEAVAGIGGGRTIDVTKFAANMAGIPMVSVATNLSHDGIASPTSSLEHESGKGSYGVAPPVAVIVDLDSVHAAPGPAGPGRDRGRRQQLVRHRGLGTGRGRQRGADRRPCGHPGQVGGPGGAAPAGHDRIG